MGCSAIFLHWLEAFAPGTEHAPSPCDFFIAPGSDNIQTRADHKVKVIGKTGKVEQVNCYASIQAFQLVLDPDFSMIEVFSGDGIITH